MIKVTDKYYIGVSDCYTVYERSIVQSGKNQGNEVFGDAHYFPTMTMALNNIVHKMQMEKLSGDEIIPLKLAIQEMMTIQKEFTELVKSIEYMEEK